MNPKQPSSRNGNWLLGCFNSTVKVVPSAADDAMADACNVHCDAFAGSA